MKLFFPLLHNSSFINSTIVLFAFFIWLGFYVLLLTLFFLVSFGRFFVLLCLFDERMLKIGGQNKTAWLQFLKELLL